MSKTACGNATLQKYGPEYYRAIGRLGGRPRYQNIEQVRAASPVLNEGVWYGEDKSLKNLKRLYAERSARQCLNK
ncbi:hypothetical protein SDC9_42693 [bioreactor metagenome]|uniref:Uncharacterized protein n=1 Tax=bioreactor metagenome TaxID=1076179 RepID=A0A644VYL3_9ZZZZ